MIIIKQAAIGQPAVICVNTGGYYFISMTPTTDEQVEQMNKALQSECSETRDHMVLYAWVGEDELGSGEMGLKQAMVPAGCIPLVACKEGKVDQPYIIKQLQEQATTYGKTIKLCKFVYSGDLITITP